MPFFDVFNSSAFKFRSMTSFINKIPLVTNYLDQEGIFEETGTSTTAVAIEEQQGTLAIIPNSGRGEKGISIAPKKRNVVSFVCSHKQINDEILADQVLGVRRFGSETEMETVAQKLAEKLEDAKNIGDQTLEYMRIGCVKGQVIDADGSVVDDMYDKFGVKKDTDKWSIPKGNVDDGYIKRKCNNLIRSRIKLLGGTPMTRIDILCGNDFFDAVETSDEIRNATRWLQGQMSNFLVEGHAWRYFDYAGVRFVNYMGFLGQTDFLDPKTAQVVPRGVKELFKMVYAPAPYQETVNTVGIRYYAKSERMEFDKGVQIECQTNPLAVCTRPAALQQITLG